MPALCFFGIVCDLLDGRQGSNRTISVALIPYREVTILTRPLLPAVCLLLVAVGCSTLRKIPPHEGERVLGTLQLHFDVPGGDQQGRRSFDLIVDLDKRKWSGVLEGQRKRFCIYRLDGDHLLLDLREEILSTTQSVTRTFFDTEGNPQTVIDKVEERIEWLVISIKGTFRERGADFVEGPFQGTAIKSQEVEIYTRRSQRRNRVAGPEWEGSVTGICWLKGQQVSRLHVRHQREDQTSVSCVYR